MSPTIRKKGKVSYEDFYQLSSFLDKRLKEIEEKEEKLIYES